MSDDQIKEIVIACIESKNIITFDNPIADKAEIEESNKFNAQQIIDFVTKLREL